MKENRHIKTYIKMTEVKGAWYISQRINNPARCV